MTSQSYEEGTNWKTIESAPRDGTDILVFCPARSGVGPYQEISYFGYRNWEDRQGNDLSPTHWQSLPMSPGEKSDVL